MAINPTPAKIDIYFGLICCDNMLPKITPKAEVKTNAKDAPRKTVILLTSLSAANNIVASWVLSPSSATKITENTVNKILKSIFIPYFRYYSGNITCSWSTGKSNESPIAKKSIITFANVKKCPLFPVRSMSWLSKLYKFVTIQAISNTNIQAPEKPHKAFFHLLPK